MGGSSQITTSPSRPLLLSPSLLHPSRREDCAAALGIAPELGAGIIFIVFLSFSSPSLETLWEFLPFPCAPSQRGRLLQQRVNVE